MRVSMRNLDFDNKMLVSENSSLKLKITRLEDTIRCAKIREENQGLLNE